MRDTDMWWPCPFCGETESELVHWDDAQVTWIFDEATGKKSAEHYSMRSQCDTCGETGRMVYAAR